MDRKDGISCGSQPTIARWCNFLAFLARVCGDEGSDVIAQWSLGSAFRLVLLGGVRHCRRPDQFTCRGFCSCRSHLQTLSIDGDMAKKGNLNGRGQRTRWLSSYPVHIWSGQRAFVNTKNAAKTCINSLDFGNNFQVIPVETDLVKMFLGRLPHRFSLTGLLAFAK